MCSLQIRSCSFPPITDSLPCGAQCALPCTHILFHSTDNRGKNLEPGEKAFSQHANCIFSLCMLEDSSVFSMEICFLCYSGILLSMLSSLKEEEISLFVFSVHYSELCSVVNLNMLKNKKNKVFFFVIFHQIDGFWSISINSFLFLQNLLKASVFPSCSEFHTNLWLCTVIDFLGFHICAMLKLQ